MKKFNPNKNIIITLILMILAVTVLSVSIAKRAVEEKTTMVQIVINDTTAIVDKVIYTPVRWVEKGVTSVQDLFITYEENEALKEKIDQYDEIEQKTKNQEREIAKLQEELELNATLTNFEKTTANVITRSPDTWQDMLVIDKGTKDGIEVNMSVMSRNGLVGRIIEANAASSKVELLTSTNQTSNHFPVRITTEKGDAFGVLKGYDEKREALIIEQLTGKTDIKEGNVVQTSGLGGNSPADLMVGKVIETQTDSFGLDRKIYVEANAQMYDLSVVTVIERTLGEN
ncbi:MAG TPA: rod shape-determining protein MreC [Candidatus Tetragenococcus pullicola]|nr:rod shape-determining protein MreC [Candidatus Tetragenococcus pullicola]